MPDDGKAPAQDNERMSDINLADAAESMLALAAPAIFSNGVAVLGTSAGVRISFLESAPGAGSPVPRTAVMLDYQTVLGLRDLLTAQLTGGKKVGN